MARVTIEDCLGAVKNRFELVLLASKRARDLLRTGRDPYVAWEKDKATVVALREIAGGFIDRNYLDAELSSVKEETTDSVEEAPQPGVE